MSKQVFQNSSFSGGLMVQDFTMQSILDVFVIQGLITQEDSDNLKRRFRNNAEIEKILVSNRIVTRETINKAYSILLKIPYVSLANTKIDSEILNIIPQKIAQRYGAIAFGVNGNDLQLAISKPLELNNNFRNGMENLMANKPYTISLYITGPDDFTEAIKQYRGATKELKLKTSSFPVVFLRNQNIPKTLLQRLPLDFIKKHRAVIFAQKNENCFYMAAERPDDTEVRRAIEYIQKQNKVSIQLMATAKEDINFIIDHYDDEYIAAKLNEADKNGLEMQGYKPNPLENRQVAESQKDKNSNTENEKDQMIENGNQNESARSDKISFSDIFSPLRGNKSNTPVLTIDNVENEDGNNADIQPVDKENVQNEDALTDETPESVQDDTKNDKPGEDKTAESEPESIMPKNEEAQPDPVTIEGTTDNKQPDQKKEEKISQPIDEDMDIGNLLEGDIKNDQEFKKILSEKYIPKVVAAIINYALFQRSSDVHIEASAKDVRVRYRIDGILRDVARLPIEMHPPMISRIKILAKMKIDETRIPQDGRFDVIFKSKQVDVRVSALPTVHGEKIVMRVLDKDQGVLSLEDLGMVGRAFDLTIENIAKPYGIILSTGPTGSGKSTTLYAILNRISTPSVNIITLEDPVEYEINGVSQCQIKPAIGFTFAEGLRSVLRQDPNVVMVGEIRDGETAAMATHAALTGHLVLSTLHTNDAPGALPRLTNMGIEPFLITSSINEIIAQRLVRKICPKCKEEMKVPQQLSDAIKREFDKIPANNKRDQARVKSDLKFFHGVGCSECNNGYRGRVGIFEVLRMTEKVESLAIDRRSTNDIREAAIEDGMITMKLDGLLKCNEGITTIDEVYRATTG